MYVRTPAIDVKSVAMWAQVAIMAPFCMPVRSVDAAHRQLDLSRSALSCMHIAGEVDSRAQGKERRFVTRIATIGDGACRSPRRECSGHQFQSGKERRFVTVAAKMQHLENFYDDFPTMCAPRMNAGAYERLNCLSSKTLLKWRSRCLSEHWYYWSDEARRRYCNAPQSIRNLYGLPRLGRKFDNFYPPAVMDRARAYVQKELVPTAPGQLKRRVKTADIQNTLHSLVLEENRKAVIKHQHKNPGAPVGTCTVYRGTGSHRAARRLRVEMGLVNRGTKFSKNEITLDSPEMIEFTALLRRELENSVVELLANMDEMWRRQMRDDRVKALHYGHGLDLDLSEAKPSIRLTTVPSSTSRVRLLVEAEFASWRGPARTSTAECEGDRRTAESLVAGAGTYRDFDKWQAQVQCRRAARRLPGRRPAPRSHSQTHRCAAPPGGSHRKGKTIITFLFASGHRGPGVTMYSKSNLSMKAAAQANERYAPEHIFHNTGKRSHMVDAELFLWYLDVVVREGLRQQREYLTQQGRDEDARKIALLVVDPAPGHKAFKRGLRIRTDLLEKELHLKILEAPPGYSAVGQPCDQIHRQVQAKEDGFMSELAGECTDLRFRCDTPRTSTISALEVSMIRKGQVAAEVG